MPRLVTEFEFYAHLTFDDVGMGPFGHRNIANIAGGEFSGDRLSGVLVGSGGDWLLLGADGFGRLDVRTTLKTNDSALLYMQYGGVIEATEDVVAILGGAEISTDYGDQYFFTSPRIETGDERYTWVNETMFLGEGCVIAGPAVQYRVYRIENSY